MVAGSLGLGEGLSFTPSTRADPNGAFDENVVFELVRRAEIGEALQASVRSEPLRELAPAEGYSSSDF